MLIVVKDLMGTGTVRGYRYFLLKTEHWPKKLDPFLLLPLWLGLYVERELLPALAVLHLQATTGALKYMNSITYHLNIFAISVVEP